VWEIFPRFVNFSFYQCDKNMEGYGSTFDFIEDDLDYGFKLNTNAKVHIHTGFGMELIELDHKFLGYSRVIHNGGGFSIFLTPKEAMNYVGVRGKREFIQNLVKSGGLRLECEDETEDDGGKNIFIDDECGVGGQGAPLDMDDDVGSEESTDEKTEKLEIDLRDLSSDEDEEIDRGLESPRTVMFNDCEKMIECSEAILAELDDDNIIVDVCEKHMKEFFNSMCDAIALYKQKKK
jgi:hypothetical protein